MHTKKGESNDAKMNDKTISALTDIDKDGDLSPKQKRAFIKMLSRFIRCATWSIFHHCLVGSQWKKTATQLGKLSLQRVWNPDGLLPLSISLSLCLCIPFARFLHLSFLSLGRIRTLVFSTCNLRIINSVAFPIHFQSARQWSEKCRWRAFRYVS